MGHNDGMIYLLGLPLISVPSLDSITQF